MKIPFAIKTTNFCCVGLRRRKTSYALPRKTKLNKQGSRSTRIRVGCSISSFFFFFPPILIFHQLCNLRAVENKTKRKPFVTFQHERGAYSGINDLMKRGEEPQSRPAKPIKAKRLQYDDDCHESPKGGKEKNIYAMLKCTPGQKRKMPDDTPPDSSDMTRMKCLTVLFLDSRAVLIETR